MKLRVAGAKLPVSTDIAENQTRICTAIERAAAAKADILLTPEGSLSGYTHEFDAAAARKSLATVTQLAHTKRVGLALGTCFVEDDGHCYNQIRFYRPDGAYLGCHQQDVDLWELGRSAARRNQSLSCVTPADLSME